MRERRIDLERLLRFALRRLGRHEAPRARIVQAVGELDDEHPDVFRHRDDHLADRLGLGGVPELDLVDLGDAVDEHPDLVAEVRAQLIDRVRSVLHRVVQERRSDRLRPDAEVGEDLCDRERVRDVRLAALAGLARVRPLRHLVGALDEGDIGLGMLLPHRLGETLETTRGLRAREDAGQERAQRRTLLLRRLGHPCASCCDSTARA